MCVYVWFCYMIDICYIYICDYTIYDIRKCFIWYTYAICTTWLWGWDYYMYDRFLFDWYHYIMHGMYHIDITNCHIFILSYYIWYHHMQAINIDFIIHMILIFCGIYICVWYHHIMQAMNIDFTTWYLYFVVLIYVWFQSNYNTRRMRSPCVWYNYKFDITKNMISPYIL